MLRVFCKTCKTLLIEIAKDSRTSHALFLRTISSAESASGTLGSINQQNLTVSYLMNSCGLPFKAAISAAQKICIETTGRPDSVIELFRIHGFTDIHIANLITKYPPLLLAHPVKILKPKIEFFQSLGFSTSDLAKFFSLKILRTSLQKRIIPTSNFLKTIIHTNDNLISALKRSRGEILDYDFKSVLEPNVATLRSYGVPDSIISKMIILRPMSLTRNILQFKDVTALVNNMGFNPNSCSFFLAISSLTVMSQEKWERKREAFKSFGWSDDEFHMAFKIQPMVMLTSEKKLSQLMDFFVNDLHLKPSAVAKCPNLFLLSLERRIIPRCSVLQVLMSKGLIEKDVNILSPLDLNKRFFEKRYVSRYKEQAPDIVKAYEGEIRFTGFDS